MLRSDYLANRYILNGYDLLSALKDLISLGDKNSWWWPSSDSVEVVDCRETKGSLTPEKPLLYICIASILGQNTKYENVQKSMDNLMNLGILKGNDIHTLINADCELLSYAIKPSGFHNRKTNVIKSFTKSIKEEFGNFESFAEHASKEWLLSLNGIGLETADSILNYALKREYIVVDNYTRKLLSSIGYDATEYEYISGWLKDGLVKARNLYDFDISLAQIYARLHGKIVEFSKRNKPRTDREIAQKRLGI